VLPDFFISRRADHILRYVESLRQCGQKFATRSQLANRFDVLFCEFSAGVALTFSACLACAAFAIHVGVVVCSGAKEHVRRANASWSIAGVAQTKSVWYWAIEQLVGVAMGKHYTVLNDCELPVALCLCGAVPYPARVCFCYEIPKSCNWIGSVSVCDTAWPTESTRHSSSRGSTFLASFGVVHTSFYSTYA
jgi:hypothetical protein